MPIEERRERWNAMMATLERNDVDDWFANFIHALEGTSRPARLPATEQTALAPALTSA
jgi:trehalose 6-phosphate synthase